MSRYLCLRCWRTPAESETTPQPEASQPDIDARAQQSTPSPVGEATTGAARPKRPWLVDLNAVQTATTSVAPLRQPAPAKGGISGVFDSLFGEDEGASKADKRGGRRVCPCGAILGSDAVLGGQPTLLGFVGARSAGKTVLLLSSLQQWDLEEDSFALLGVGDTEDRIRRLRLDFFGNRRKPGATEPDAPQTASDAYKNGYCWRMQAVEEGERRDRQASRAGEGAQLFGVFDVAGESWQDLDRAGNERLLRYLELVDKLVFVVDGAALAGDIGLDSSDAWTRNERSGDGGAADLQIFSSLCAHLGPERTRRMSLAIVVSKADLFWQEKEWAGLGPESTLGGVAQQELIAGLLKKSFRGSLWASRSLFRRAGLFAVSGLGFRPMDADVEEDLSLVRPPRPHNVLEPLRFLLEETPPRRKP